MPISINAIKHKVDPASDGNKPSHNRAVNSGHEAAPAATNFYNLMLQVFSGLITSQKVPARV